MTRPGEPSASGHVDVAAATARFHRQVIADVRLRRHLEGRDLSAMRALHAAAVAATLRGGTPAVPTTPDGERYPPEDYAIVAGHLRAAVAKSQHGEAGHAGSARAGQI